MNPETQPGIRHATPVEAVNDAVERQPYQHYWHEVAGLSRQFGERTAARVSEHNATDLEKLEPALINPHEVRYGNRVIAPEQVPEEWYSKLGPMNRLEGAQHMLRVGFGRLWEAAQPHPKFDRDPESSFKKAAIDILSYRDEEGNPSATFRRIVERPEHASRALLAGNALLDFVRATPFHERSKQHLAFLNVASKLNDGVLDAALERDPTEPHNKRIVSDALKFKYETLFEAAVTEWKSGTISEDKYQEKVNMVLYHQLADTQKYANEDRLTNGDLNEHYFTALLRYGMTGWRDETRYMVHAATRRQDEPHDGFAPMNLPTYSFDASIHDMEGADDIRYVQLKLPHAERKRYADGIIVIDDVLSSKHGSDRREIVTGMNQLQGLVHELATGQHYSGNTAQVAEHIHSIQNTLELEPSAVR
jgi:hypothetical protein